MAHADPIITRHPTAPYFTPQREADAGLQPGQMEALYAAASREEARRDAALLRALNEPPRVAKPKPALKEPRLPEDFAQRIADLDQKIYERGIAVQSDTLVSLGEEWFQQLLAADRAARTLQRVISTRCDLTSWPSVWHALATTGALGQVPVSARKTHEQMHGLNKEVDEARAVEGFADLWKLSRAQPQAIRAISAFREIFESLAFGQSLLGRLTPDGRVHSKFFCGSCGHKVRYFEDWLPALNGTHHRVALTNPLAAVVFWLAGDTSEPPHLVQLAREYFNTRVPSEKQIRCAGAVLDGFLLNYKGWGLWQFVGRGTSTLPDDRLLGVWQQRLEKRFRRIQRFHHEIENCFWRAVGNHHEFESARHRRFINRTVQKCLDVASAVLAVAIEASFPGTTVGRFRGQVLCEGKPEPPRAEITGHLAAAFPSADFPIDFTEVQQS